MHERFNKELLKKCISVFVVEVSEEDVAVSHTVDWLMKKSIHPLESSNLGNSLAHQMERAGHPYRKGLASCHQHFIFFPTQLMHLKRHLGDGSMAVVMVYRKGVEVEKGNAEVVAG
ncbi:hypothetical protein P7K49_016476 [Saguinus oedipus]|uniref:Uncharacterized protein n=1 Tax=Saguinus oedipus TaxID=9490 RepID=A0ABQ9VCM6_SAGOE|nr:hypothetical protein P7K49_016476 [Saguinus oedipus]